jgi:hypothetical protein
MEALNGVQSSLPTEVTIAVPQQLQFFFTESSIKNRFRHFLPHNNHFLGGEERFATPNYKTRRSCWIGQSPQWP